MPVALCDVVPLVGDVACILARYCEDIVPVGVGLLPEEGSRPLADEVVEEDEGAAAPRKLGPVERVDALGADDELVPEGALHGVGHVLVVHEVEEP